jgi:ABC-type lipoprotein export system ATPase subunit
MKHPIIETINACKTFPGTPPLQIVNNLNLCIEKGQSLAIKGKSGSGKTTLLHILGTLEPVTSGKIFIAGKLLNRHNIFEIRNQFLGFIFQSFHLLADFSVQDNIMMPALISRFRFASKEKTKLWGLSLLERVGLLDKAEQSVKLLSGGEKQRVALVRALINNPQVILADEPTGNLDSQNARIVFDMLLSLCKEHGKTLILVTHDDDLATLCDSRQLLNEGCLHPL